MKKFFLFVFSFCLLAACSKSPEQSAAEPAEEDVAWLPQADSVPTVYVKGAESFVVLTDVIPDLILEMRYFSAFNFVGERIPGYDEPVAILTRQAADSLKRVSDDLREQGYLLKIFDAYRPQCAVDRFVEWAKDTADTRMQAYFYPEVRKSNLLSQYIARRSGHSRGSTVDLTLFDMKKQKEVDMGCTFDYFGRASHPSVRPGEKIGAYPPISEEQYRHRMLLREAMMRHGFKPLSSEWWHFTLINEPFPSTYFNFPVRTESLPPSNRECL